MAKKTGKTETVAKDVMPSFVLKDKKEKQIAFIYDDLKDAERFAVL